MNTMSLDVFVGVLLRTYCARLFAFTLLIAMVGCGEGKGVAATDVNGTGSSTIKDPQLGDGIGGASDTAAGTDAEPAGTDAQLAEAGGSDADASDPPDFWTDDTLAPDVQGTDATADSTPKPDVNVGCKMAADCNDNNVCTDDKCDPVIGCVRTNNTQVCDDGDACTTGEICASGVCAGIWATDCSDGNPCTAKGCDPKTGCFALNVGGKACDDGQACSSTDVCAHGVCIGIAPECKDSNPCTDDTCTDAAGCVFLANAVTCDDGSACTVGDSCKDGACTAGIGELCDDGNPCTSDLCNTGAGCSHVAIAGSCDDGNACTSGDACANGQCGGTAVVCNDANPCTSDGCSKASGCWTEPLADGCSDGNACTMNDTCVAGTCQPGPIGNCDDGNTCTADSCDAQIGCVHAETVVSCDDSSACTTGDSCVGALCKAGSVVDCGDNNPCTNDACDAQHGCQHTNVDGGSCDDGKACSTNDTCAHGVCLGVVLSCDDNNPCTDNSCDNQGGCVFLANDVTCDDGNACTTGEACHNHACGAGAVVQCDDKNPCTQEVCDPKSGCKGVVLNGSACEDGDACTIGDTCVSGQCASNLLSCEDNNPCTLDSCDKAAGCIHTALTSGCDDGDACTANDTCLAGICSGTPAAPCDDGNACTNDVCDKTIGCVFTPNSNPCSDGDVCTSNDLCVNGTCVSGAALACNDQNPCTKDSCQALTGCVFRNDDGKACDDGQTCSVNDTCSGGLCSGFAPNCGDDNGCTNDSCADGVGCVHLANTAACDDGNACTTADTCSNKGCVGGAAPNCNDSNFCTSDACDNTMGCVHQNKAVACDDGDACTTGDTCSGGACVPSGVAGCDDGNPCTIDGCTPLGGCTHSDALPATACDDANACTVGDTCLGQTCVGAIRTCDDGDPCTADGCDPASGCTTPAGNDGASCTDTNACTAEDACANGVCKGSPVVCNDGNPCTDDACDVALGCVAPFNTASCDDGVACTHTDTCVDGNCRGAPTNGDCDDSNPCTVDTCNALTGCVSAAGDDGAVCSDGNACTNSDACLGGQCLAGSPTACLDVACNTVACDPESGLCVYTPFANHTPCEDGNACTLADACQTGACVAGTPAVCVGKACNTVTCNPLTGACDYVAIADDVTCDDANACTNGDRCTGGTCQSGSPTSCEDRMCNTVACNTTTGACDYTPVADTTGCDDGNACTTVDTCAQGACVGGTPVICAALDQCHDPGLCDTGTGACSNPEKEDGVSCTDDDACTQIDICFSGMCAGVAPVICEAIDECHTAGVCDPGNGLCSQPNAADGLACSDENACTQIDTCIAGACIGSSSVACAALDQCHAIGTCDTTTGTCSQPPVPNATTCNDGDACTLSDVCTNGACGGTAADCGDTLACTTDACNPATGCTHTPVDAACTDGIACTTDTCVLGIGCVHVGHDSACDDLTACTSDACENGVGCIHTPNNNACADGNVCTTDLCTSGAGCSNPAGNNGGACTDGGICTSTNSMCNGGLCTLVPACNDNNACTTDACNPTTGACTHVGGLCGTGGTCVADSDCSSGSCNPTSHTCNAPVTCGAWNVAAQQGSPSVGSVSGCSWAGGTNSNLIEGLFPENVYGSVNSVVATTSSSTGNTIKVGQTLTITSLSVKIAPSWSTSTALTFTVRVNNVDSGTAKCTVAAGATTCSAANLSQAVLANQTLNLHIVQAQGQWFNSATATWSVGYKIP